jgi:hypothetical protein
MRHVSVERKRLRAIHTAVTALFETLRLSRHQNLNGCDAICVQDLPDALSDLNRALCRRSAREASEAANLQFF